MNSKQNPSPAPQKPSFRQDRLLLAAGIIIFLLVFGELWRRISQASDLRALESRIGIQVTRLAEESDRMNTLIAGAQSDEAVAEWARGQGKMVLPGEVLVQPIAATIAPTPQATPSGPMDNPPKWRVWWEWLLGSE